jgi:hypothetical protein
MYFEQLRNKAVQTRNFPARTALSGASVIISATVPRQHGPGLQTRRLSRWNVSSVDAIAGEKQPAPPNLMIAD